MDFKQTICENEEFDRLVSKLAFEIKNTLDVKNLAFVGVKTRGVPLAERLAKEIKKQTKQVVPVGSIDIAPFRDDNRNVKKAELKGFDFEVENKHIVVVDDVLFTGRTMRAAVSGVLAFGRPASVSVCVLCDRPGYLQMPVLARFVGVSLETAQDDVVSVSVKEIDKENSVKIYSY